MARRGSREGDDRRRCAPDAHAGARADADERWVCVGAIGAPKGVDGAFVVKAFTRTPEGLRRFERFRLGDTGREVRLEFGRPARGGLLARIEGVADREAARALAGTLLHVRRADLPPLSEEEDEFYLVDLVGLTVRDTCGRRLGEVRAVQDFGAGDLLEILLDAPLEGFGRHLLLPFERALVPEVATAEGFLVVDLQAWLARHGDGRAERTGGRRAPDADGKAS